VTLLKRWRAGQLGLGKGGKNMKKMGEPVDFYGISMGFSSHILEKIVKRLVEILEFTIGTEMRRPKTDNAMFTSRKTWSIAEIKRGFPSSRPPFII